MAMVAYANPNTRIDKPVRITLLRKAAWNGLLVPTCNCLERVFESKDDWIYCTNCKGPVRPLDGLEQLAPSLDDALTIALEKCSS